jgi:molybdopterin adenylyltransferase
MAAACAAGTWTVQTVAAPRGAHVAARRKHRLVFAARRDVRRRSGSCREITARPTRAARVPWYGRRPAMSNPPPKIGIVTISDRASRAIYDDHSGPAIEAALRDYLATTCDYERHLVPDERDQIAAAVRGLSSAGCCLVCTTGGTGPAPRDVTPEALADVFDKTLPGFGEEMRRASLAAGVPTAILSRQTAGIVGSTLVVTLPGKPASIRVCLDAVFPAIPYCIELIGGPYLEGNPAVVQVFRPKK